MRLDIDASDDDVDDNLQPSTSQENAAPSSPVSPPSGDDAASSQEGDSDWGAVEPGEMSGEDPDPGSDVDLAAIADAEEYDYVSQHDSSIDSDEPLAQARVRRNQPGTKDYVWKDADNFRHRVGFSGKEGVDDSFGLTEDSTPREFFDCFFTPDLWRTMVTETNRYADQNPPRTSSHMKAWVGVDEVELQRYLGLRLLMGILHFPRYHDYWSTRRHLGHSTFKEQMSRDRFDR